MSDADGGRGEPLAEPARAMPALRAATPTRPEAAPQSTSATATASSRSSDAGDAEADPAPRTAASHAKTEAGSSPALMAASRPSSSDALAQARRPTPASPLPPTPPPPSGEDVARWRESREYHKLERELHKLLTAIDGTALADWAAQAHLLGQLLRCVQQYKDVVGAVELPNGLHVAKTLARTLSPQSVLGVQRKALEVVQCYLDCANPVYPMAKDLPYVLPALLELLPLASMQVKADVLELLDGSLVRRLPPTALRGCAQGLLTALLSCLEESETSGMYRRAMALLEYIQTTLVHSRRTPWSAAASLEPRAAPGSPPLPQCASELHGAQVLSAHTWLLIRDAAPLRPQALTLMKTFVADSSATAAGGGAVVGDGASHDAAAATVAAERAGVAAVSAPISAGAVAGLPDWVGGDAEVVATALLNSLQDVQERTHRLALDLLLVCPLAATEPVTAMGAPAALPRARTPHAGEATAAAALSSPTSQPAWSDCSTPLPPPHPPACGTLFSFDVKALLVAAAVQLLGSRHGTPSVARRVLQWLTVDPTHGSGSSDGAGDAGGGAAAARAFASAGLAGVDDAMDEPAASSTVAAAVSSYAYVRDVTSYVLSHGFYMVVAHWEARWGRPAAGPAAAAASVPPFASGAVASMERAATHAGSTTPSPRLATASTVAAALSGREAKIAPSTASVDVPAAVAVPLVWLRALCFLLRYRGLSEAAGVGDGADAAQCTSPDAADLTLHEDEEVPPREGAVAPFLVHVAPLLLPQLGRLIASMPHAVTTVGTAAASVTAAAAWTAELRELLRVLPWTLFIDLDTCVLRAVTTLVEPALEERHLSLDAQVTTSAHRVEGCAPSAAAHLPAVAVPRAERRITEELDHVHRVAAALVPVLVDAAAEQPAAAQEYARASLKLAERVAVLLSRVLRGVGAAAAAAETVPAPAAQRQVLLSAANALLRLLVQRVQEVLQPLLDTVLATASATATPSVVTVDFFSAVLSDVDACVLQHVRAAATSLTAVTLHKASAAAVRAATLTAELQQLLARLHRTTLRLTSFLSQLHLRCRQRALFGVLLDSASEDGAGAQERELAKHTSAWLAGLCESATTAAEAGAQLFFTRAVRLILDVLQRGRGCLLPEAAYRALEPRCPVTGGFPEAAAFCGACAVTPVVRSLWKGTAPAAPQDAAAAALLPHSPHGPAAHVCDEAGDYADAGEICTTALLALLAVSPACARCFDVVLLETPTDAAVPRLITLHRALTDLRAEQRRGRVQSSTSPLAIAALQDPGVLFLGCLVLLDCVVYVPCTLAARTAACPVTESTRQLARAYVSGTVAADLHGLLLPLFSSFVCPLMPVSPSTVSAPSAAAADGLSRLTTVALTVLLPPTTTPKPLAAPALTASPASAASPHPEGDGNSNARRVYRCVEAAELVHYLAALLQCPSAGMWVRLAMRSPTPNALRVLLRGLEAQSFVPSEEGEVAATAAAPACEGPTDTMFAATALTLLSVARHALLSVHATHMRLQDSLARRVRSRRGSTSTTSEWHTGSGGSSAERSCSTLLDAMACLNRLLEVSQTGPRMQPHHTARQTWQYTSTQLLPLLRLAVQADLHAVQAVLLEHIRGVVWYLDDVEGGQGKRTPARGHGEGAAAASRHWAAQPLQLLDDSLAGRVWRSGDSTANGAHDNSASGGHDSSARSASEEGHGSATPILDELRRAPPAVLANKSLYAMLGEVVEHVLSRYEPPRAAAAAAEVVAETAGNVELALASEASLSTAADAAAAAVARRENEATLSRWLSFYRDVLPYLYRDLVPSAEMVVDVLLGALEGLPGVRGDGAAGTAYVVEGSAAAQAQCYAALVDVAQFLCRLAVVADLETYEAALRTKESMSWIASTFTQEDPVAQARRATLWERSSVLSPLRGGLPRLVSAATRCLRACEPSATTPAEAAGVRRSAVRAMWDTDVDADEMLGWRCSSSRPGVSGPVLALCEQAQRLLRLLSEAAGASFIAAYVRHWCDQYAANTALWVFESAPQRAQRVARQGGTLTAGYTATRQTAVDPESSSGVDGVDAIEQRALYSAKDEAQRAASALLRDTRASMSDVTAALGPLLRTAIEKQPPAKPHGHSSDPPSAVASRGGSAGRLEESEPAPPLARPSPAAELLFFLVQLVEGCAADAWGCLTERDSEAVLAVLADVVAQRPPDTLSFSCLLHALYCVVAYAKDAGAEAAAEGRRTRRSGGRGGQQRTPAHPGAGDAASAPATVTGTYRNRDFSFALCRLLESYRLPTSPAQRSGALLSLRLLCHTLQPVLPPSMGLVDNAGRVVDAATHVLQRALLPVLRRGIASVSEAEILLYSPLVCACLRVLRALIAGFAPDLAFERRAQRDLLSLLFSENFFRYSRGALHEWALLLRQWSTLDPSFHGLVCERVVPSPGRLSAMMMSREAEAALWERSLKSLSIYTYAVYGGEATALAAVSSSAGSASAASTAAGTAVRQAEFLHLLRERIAQALQHFSSTTVPTAEQLQRREVFVQPVRAALLLFRVVLLSNVRETLAASLWPLVLPEVLRALSIALPVAKTYTTAVTATPAAASAATAPAALDAGVRREVVALQMEALKVLDTDYTLYPAHALAFRWLFADDAAAVNLAALQLRTVSAPVSEAAVGRSGLPGVDHLTRAPVVSQMEVLHILQATAPNVAAAAAAHLDAVALMDAVHEVCDDASAHSADTSRTHAAPCLDTIHRMWPRCPRPSAADRGLRRPLFNIPCTHYPRLQGVHQAAQAFTALLQRLDMQSSAEGMAASTTTGVAASEPSPQLRQPQSCAASLVQLSAAVRASVGLHNEVDMAYLCDLLEADMTSTDPDTMM